MDCIFCQIVAGQIRSDIVYRDEEVVAFHDIHPVASTHVLLVPTRHIPSVADMAEKDLPLIGRMVGVANELARREGVAQDGYRLVINSGKFGGQIVPHLHLHLIGGRRLSDTLG